MRAKHVRKFLDHAHFYSFIPFMAIVTLDMVSGHPTDVHYFESGDGKTRLSCNWNMEADGRQALYEMSNAY